MSIVKLRYLGPPVPLGATDPYTPPTKAAGKAPFVEPVVPLQD